VGGMLISVDKLAGNDPAGPARLLAYPMESLLVEVSHTQSFSRCRTPVLLNDGIRVVSYMVNSLEKIFLHYD
jgi:hypothetical protein